MPQISRIRKMLDRTWILRRTRDKFEKLQCFHFSMFLWIFSWILGKFPKSFSRLRVWTKTQCNLRNFKRWLLIYIKNLLENQHFSEILGKILKPIEDNLKASLHHTMRSPWASGPKFTRNTYEMEVSYQIFYKIYLIF